jgi:hypothetical protein
MDPASRPDIGPMHPRTMAHRTQIVLTDAQYDRLRAESARTGLALAELVRRAVDERYPERRPSDPGVEPSSDVAAAIRRAAGVWVDRPFDGAAYIEALRSGHPLPG